MSKYYKTKDVYEAVGRAFVSDKLADREVTLVTDELADLPTIEVSEELPKDIVEPIGNGNVIMSEETYDELIEQSVSLERADNKGE